MNNKKIYIGSTGDGTRQRWYGAILAIVSQLQYRKIILFYEIENKISVNILEKLLALLESAVKQVILTVRSILILNYIDPKNILLVYKDSKELTKSKPLG